MAILSRDVVFRYAQIDDLDDIVKMLADDKLGQKRERYAQPLPISYVNAFQAISIDPNNELIVACFEEKVIGVAQLTFTPHLTHLGGWRATIEGVRTASSHRDKGIGTKLIQHAIQISKERGCHLVQLTTDKQREAALHFYQNLGFEATHEGLKLKIDSNS